MVREMPSQTGARSGSRAEDSTVFRAPGKRTLLAPWEKPAQKAPISVISETQEWQGPAPPGLPAAPGEEGLGAGTAT